MAILGKETNLNGLERLRFGDIPAQNPALSISFNFLISLYLFAKAHPFWRAREEGELEEVLYARVA